ncbi:Flp pilus assembly protein CpaB [Pseudomonas sp. 8Z]|uniref:Flp pilus assembly protein CpaB n=1 Tax=Pseudomonas sp. 8Z TaxID=2653166 RepID=UPI0012F07C64|nr:Flp pilus assembly protein CpaB [Pseudomonas sp. 8Z]VXD00691.1 Flp pilus assembly protein CpaB [Pseudomonas sp. 8Z]
MKTPSVLLVAGTLLVAGSAALLARVLLTPPPPPPPVVEKPVIEKPKPTYPAVLVASRDLRPGEFIDAGAVEWKASDSQVDERLYYTRGSEAASQLTGASVRHAITAGTPLTNGIVVRPNEPGFIATVITPGMRAITVPTNQTASQHSMLTSGDRVDVMLNLERDEQGSAEAGNAPRLAAQTLLQNVRVLSLDNQTRSPLQQRPSEPANGKKNADAYPSRSAQTVTLEVPPVYAERLALASQVGTLNLILRSSQEVGDGQVKVGSGRVTTLAQTTSVYRVAAPSGQRAPVKTFHGDASNTVQFGTP